MTSFAYDVAFYIAGTLAQGVLATNVFVNDLPSSPDNVIAVFEYGGSGSGKGMGSDAHPLENSALQIVVRNCDASQAQAIAYAIFTAFDQLVTVTINSNAYTSFEPMQPPFLLERDANARVVFAFNLEDQRVRT
jgi:hypothetical protein